jgi:hypothetical protein
VLRKPLEGGNSYPLPNTARNPPGSPGLPSRFR